MPDIKNCSADGGFKEAVCIDAGRVYDSCCDRDCLEDLRCFFLQEDQSLIADAVSVRLKTAEVLNVYVDVEPVNYNKGFYSCDLTFFFLLGFDVFTQPYAEPTEIQGISSYSKKVILFGSCGSVKTFSNTVAETEESVTLAKQSSNTPKCVIQTVDPIPLAAKLGHIHDSYENVRFIPDQIRKAMGGDVITQLQVGEPTIYASIGLFSVVQLIRNVQMLIPVYDFCIPEKQCDGSTDQPCDTFRRIEFPTDDFFPPRPCELGNNCGCSE